MLSPLRYLFFLLFVRPLVAIVLGLNVRHRERLPARGPAVVVANHNSHLDTLVLMTLFPWSLLRLLRPVAAADYFLRNRFLAWFSQGIIGIIPIERSRIATHGEAGAAAPEPKHEAPRDPLAGAAAALERGEILILFPEGTRGEPERFKKFKSGVSHLARRYPQIPVVPVLLHGLGKALPKGSHIPVPFFCDVIVGDPLHGSEDRQAFMSELETRFHALAEEGHFADWE